MTVASRRIGSIVIGSTAALALAACSSGNNSSSTSSPSAGATAAAASASCASGTLSGQGSTFQQPIELQWIKDFGQRCSGAQVSYQGTGSGAGKAALAAGTADFGGTDSLPKPGEQSAADSKCGGSAVVTPVVAGAVVLTYNLPGVSKLALSPATVAGIFERTITSWSDAKVAQDNPGVTLPHLPVVPVHRNDKSGTTNVFTSWLKATDPAFSLTPGDTVVWPAAEQSGKGSDGVTAAVRQRPGAITYTELSYATLNSLPHAAVHTAAGQDVTASADSVSAALQTAKVDTSKGDLRVTPDYTTTNPAAYPASTVSYAFTCRTGNKNAALLKAYLTFALTDGAAEDARLGYAPLPAAIATQAKAQVAALA